MTIMNRWELWADMARRMDTSTLQDALRDAICTAFAMDALDRATPLERGCRAGKYRDQCSVYRQELKRRGVKA